jgi:hypothetical protein
VAEDMESDSRRRVDRSEPAKDRRSKISRTLTEATKAAHLSGRFCLSAILLNCHPRRRAKRLQFRKMSILRRGGSAVEPWNSGFLAQQKHILESRSVLRLRKE